jgi:hypothetical protein
MSNGKNIEWKKRRTGQNVEWKNTEWDKMSNGKIAEWDKTSNEKKVEWDKMSNGNCSVPSPWRPHIEDKRMVLEYTHGLFIT